MREAPQRLAFGAHLTADGATFTVRSRHATAITLCLFERPDNRTESRRLALERLGGDRWHARVPGVRAGQLYGYRADGPFLPSRGHRFDPAKLLVDPYARAVTGEPRFGAALFDRWARGGGGLSASSAGGGSELATGDRPFPAFDGDSAPLVPRSIVVDPAFDWAEDRPPAIPWRDTLIYEAHVRGLTRRHPEVSPELRGTYLGLASEPLLDHLRRLGVTAVQLLPVHQIASEPHLARHGRTNYFGYSPLVWLAPHAGYAAHPDAADGRQVDEFKEMVRRLHAAGIEVLLDVVVNHTAEGGDDGPTLSLRGLDNASYYRTAPGAPARLIDVTGCGNTLDAGSPAAADLVVDCLVHWVEEMHVDGFRFDLAPVLGRAGGGFDPQAGLLRRITEHPALRGAKLIAEPWDAGPEGHQLGRFPRRWAEWDDRWRDAARSFWRGDPGSALPLAEALDGHRRIFGPQRPHGSLQYVACHDGFTLADLVSYEAKHNEANGEDNRDGTDHNLSRNWGAEGPTDDPEIRGRRRAVQRALLATLAFSRGVPMLGHGDEMGRTQQGNNNPYCHDSELTWVDWALDGERRALLDLAREIFRLRREHPALTGPAPDGTQPESTSLERRFLLADGRAPTAAGFPEHAPGALGLLAPRSAPARTEETLLLLLNAELEARLFRLPVEGLPRAWDLLFDSTSPCAAGERAPQPVSGEVVRLPPQSVLLLSCRPARP